MSLQTYRQKRRFDRTPEPRGRAKRAARSGLHFVVQKHDASRLHYDFRLELDGVLKSWAVPKGPSLDPGHKSLAVQVEDHPIDYGDFEGVIPHGEYGGGTVLLWDKGTWEPLHDPRKGLAQGKLHFVLDGEKLKGEWSLVRMQGRSGDGGKNWLLMKLDDEFASKRGDVLKEADSVKSGRSMQQIAGDRDEVWSGDAKKTGSLGGAKKASAPESFSPQLAVLADSAPAGDQWLHEIKFDGYRILAHVKNGKATLITRNGKDWTDKFPAVAKSLAGLKADSAVLDGEMVVLDEQGRSDFQGLQMLLKNKQRATPVYFVFDLPFCNGFDLRQTPLIDRKGQLKQILEQSTLEPRVNFSDHVIGDGQAVIDKACTMALEGVVSKRIDSPYVSRRDASWIKSKCGSRQEFIIIGYTDPQGSRTGFGSLLLGYHDAQGKLVYAGRVGTGFNNRMLDETFEQLESLAQKDPPTDVAPPARERRHAHWVKPKLVGEVQFTGWTRDGVLRHPSFVAFRSDKPASKVVREKPIKAEKVETIAKFSKEKESKSAKVETAKRHSPVPRIKSPSGDVEIAGVKLTHPDKQLYGAAGVTKCDVAEYYQFVEQWMLPHVVDRPLALVRCPEGLAGKCFFQRNWSTTLAKTIDKVNVGQGKKEEHVTVHDLAGVISLAQMGVLEIHAWGCRDDDIEHPDHLIFDLDPGPGLPWKKMIEAARKVRKTLESIGLPVFLKTSGGKGLHLTIPIERNVDWDAAKEFCATIAKSLADGSDLFVANMRKDLRGGKVYIDYNRNGRSATAVAPYSTRAREDAAVAMPISWEELGKLKSADHFRVDTARRYLTKRKQDPWRNYDASRVDLRDAVGREPAA